MSSFDEIDRKIVAALSRDARLSMTALGEVVGLSKTPVARRVRNLESSGLIRGYTALLDHNRMGSSHIAFVQVHLADTRSRSLAAFNQGVREIPEIEQCHMTAAGFDYLLKVRTADIQQFRQVLGETISNLPHVASTSSFVVMETVKDPG